MSNALNPISRIQPRWRWSSLIALNLGVALLLLSWLWAPTQMLWSELDLSGFYWLNGSLAGGGWWADIWAVTSLRSFDLLAALLMLALIVRRDWIFQQVELRQALYTFLALLALLLVFRVLFAKIVAYFGLQHSSPSLQIESSIRLSEMYPYLAEHWDLKDASKRSFPGDHASVVMLWGFFLALFTRRSTLVLVLAITAFLMLPRLVAGAHWISDDLVGGLLITLLALAWGYCTPLGGLVAKGLAKLGDPLMDFCGRLPLLKQMALFQPR